MDKRLMFFFMLFVGCSVLRVAAQTSGCTDPLANNYNTAATVNDGSCTYNATTISPVSTLMLSDTIGETSGLVWWNGYMWTHNDNTDSNIYAIDTVTGSIAVKKTVLNESNQDWEEIAQDSLYLYLGDFGNNVNGNRQNLHILRVAKADMGSASLTTDTIHFSYSDQTSFAGTGANNTDFDCEAFIVAKDSIYLFTKQWVSERTSCYVLPKVPGTYVAQLRSSQDVQGLITGATYVQDKQAVVLCGYEFSGFSLQPFVYLLYDYKGNEFFSGNKRKIYVSQPMSQVEGIATVDGLGFFITNEQLINSLFTIYARLQKVDLAPYLQPYYQLMSVNRAEVLVPAVIVYPNPSGGNITLNIAAAKATKAEMVITDGGGRTTWTGQQALRTGDNKLTLQLPEMASGVYWISVKMGDAMVRRKLSYRKK